MVSLLARQRGTERDTARHAADALRLGQIQHKISAIKLGKFGWPGLIGLAYDHLPKFLKDPASRIMGGFSRLFGKMYVQPGVNALADSASDQAFDLLMGQASKISPEANKAAGVFSKMLEELTGKSLMQIARLAFRYLAHHLLQMVGFSLKARPDDWFGDHRTEEKPAAEEKDKGKIDRFFDNVPGKFESLMKRLRKPTAHIQSGEVAPSPYQSIAQRVLAEEASKQRLAGTNPMRIVRPSDMPVHRVNVTNGQIGTPSPGARIIGERKSYKADNAPAGEIIELREITALEPAAGDSRQSMLLGRPRRSAIQGRTATAETLEFV